MEASAVPRSAPAGVSAFTSPHLLRLMSDARLVAMIREGRVSAFEAAYDRHHRGILSFCRHMLGDAQEAEDAVQHTFLAAYNHLISSQKTVHLRAWLFQIARNRCYSILRARRDRPAADLSEVVSEGLATQVQRRQDLRDLVVDIHRLPNDQRAALVLAELDALSHEQIAKALGVPREKVKALVFQARESLVASRVARETDCAEIREQLSTQRGGALRRTNLRRHLRECPGCREFRRQIERQRRQFAILLPVAPTIALKETVLAGTVGGGAGVSIAGSGLLASTAVKTGLIKGVVGIVLAGVGTAGSIVATHDVHVHGRPAAPSSPHTVPAPVAASASHPALAHSRPSVAVGVAHASWNAGRAHPAPSSSAGPAIASGAGPAIGSDASPAIGSGAGSAIGSGTGPAIGSGAGPVAAFFPSLRSLNPSATPIRRAKVLLGPSVGATPAPSRIVHAPITTLPPDQPTQNVPVEAAQPYPASSASGLGHQGAGDAKGGGGPLGSGSGLDSGSGPGADGSNGGGGQGEPGGGAGSSVSSGGGPSGAGGGGGYGEGGPSSGGGNGEGGPSGGIDSSGGAGGRRGPGDAGGTPGAGSPAHGSDVVAGGNAASPAGGGSGGGSSDRGAQGS